jgi:hypothetical protein
MRGAMMIAVHFTEAPASVSCDPERCDFRYHPEQARGESKDLARKTRPFSSR